MMAVSRENRFTQFGKLTVDDVKAVKNLWFCILSTRNPDTWEDILGNIRAFILDELWIVIPDWLKIEKDYIRHIFDNHWYDTELNLGTSVTNEEITRLPEILATYNHIEYNWFEENWKIYDRFHMKKYYWWDTYHLVVQLLKWGKIENQLWAITFYINDVVTEPNYLVAKQKWIIKQMRAKAKNQYWDRFYN